MEKLQISKCDFGQHITRMDKEKLIQLCQRLNKDEPVEELKNLEQQDLIEKYKAAWMEELFFDKE